jgi:U3 small nucleolar RNA-associated protein 10
LWSCLIWQYVSSYTVLLLISMLLCCLILQAKSVSSVISAARASAQAGSLDAQVSLQESCQAIMTQGLQHLLHLNPAAADDAQGASGSSKQAHRLQKAINAAADGVYSLLFALEAVQDCPSYLLALVQMSKQQSDSVQRRALKLLADRLSKAQIDLADLEASTEQLSAAARQSAQQELAEAGLAVCVELPRLLAPSTPAITKQLALIAADAGIRLFGKLLQSVVLASMLEVLKVVQDPSAPVRTSALTCIAAGVSSLGMQLVPLLPKTATAVLAAAEVAAQDLSALQQQQQQGHGSGSESSDSDDDADGEQQGGGGAAAALQLAGAVAALEALVTNLGAFMSPYLPRLLLLLLHRQVLRCTVADANAVAGRLRGALPVKVPSRLLLQPLLQQWEVALASCAGGSADADSASVVAAPAVALLDLVAAFCSNLQPSEAVGHHEQLAGLLLQALSTRSRWLSAASGQQQQLPSAAAAADANVTAAAAAAVAGFSAQQVWEVEGAAVRALAAMVMKLSESRFKPMFLRILDWTNAGADSQQQQGIGRVAALFAAVCTFSERLRKVFAPYYKYIFTMLMQQLAGDALAAGKRSKKKRKLSAAADAGSAGGDAVVLSSWLARLRAVRAVHLLALHEGSHDSPAAQQEQQERFDKLMPLLVEVLQDGPPAAVAAQLAVNGADPSLDLPNSPVAALGAVGAAVVEAGGSKAIEESCDIVGIAAVGALVQMAVAGGSDVVWKPLHHALLLATRGGSTRAKLLALGGVSRLAELLREDYLNLLPEALGFIAELVEDGELAVEAAAQGLLAQLEGLSGEKLEQYLKAG